MDERDLYGPLYGLDGTFLLIVIAAIISIAVLALLVIGERQ